MSSKVEELRDSWYGCLTSEFRGLLQGVHNDLDALLNTVDADAFARGKAEGTEQMKEKIRSNVIEESWGSIGEDVRRVCTIPASILTKKESV